MGEESAWQQPEERRRAEIARPENQLCKESKKTSKTASRKTKPKDKTRPENGWRLYLLEKRASPKSLDAKRKFARVSILQVKPAPN